MPLADLFPEEAHRFRLALRRSELPEFYQTRDPSGRILAERAGWLARDPVCYAALRPEGEGLLAELAGLASQWLGRPMRPDLGALGAALEPDFLLLTADANGHYRLRGGVLCFPTGWALQEKLGHTLETIHGVVPGLNAAIGAQIHQFLARLKPGPAYLRSNWGLASTSDLNLHPGRHTPPLRPPIAPDRAWLRVERQALAVLPRTHGVLFGIRIELHRLDRVMAEPAAASGLRQALTTMPETLAVYKRLAPIRRDLVALLG